MNEIDFYEEIPNEIAWKYSVLEFLGLTLMPRLFYIVYDKGLATALIFRKIFVEWNESPSQGGGRGKETSFVKDFFVRHSGSGKPSVRSGKHMVAKGKTKEK